MHQLTTKWTQKCQLTFLWLPYQYGYLFLDSLLTECNVFSTVSFHVSSFTNPTAPRSIYFYDIELAPQLRHCLFYLATLFNVISARKINECGSSLSYTAFLQRILLCYYPILHL